MQCTSTMQLFRLFSLLQRKWSHLSHYSEYRPEPGQIWKISTRKFEKEYQVDEQQAQAMDFKW